VAVLEADAGFHLLLYLQMWTLYFRPYVWPYSHKVPDLSIWSVIPLLGIFLNLMAALVNASRIEKLADLVLWQLIGRKSWF